MKIKSRYYLQKCEGNTRDRRKFLWRPRRLGSRYWRWWEWASIREQVVKEHRGAHPRSCNGGWDVWVWREVAFTDEIDSKRPDFKYIFQLKLDDGRSAVIVDWTLEDARLRAYLDDAKSDWKHADALILARIGRTRTNRTVAIETKLPKPMTVFKRQTVRAPEYCRHCGYSWDSIRPADEEYTVPECPRCHGDPTTPQSLP